MIVIKELYSLTIIKIMREHFYKIALLAVFALFLSSCIRQSKESQFVEESISSSYIGQERKIGVYIPKGYSKKAVYPVIFVEDGRVFSTGNYQHILDSLIDSDIIRPVIVACSYENQENLPGSALSYRNVEYVEKIAERDNRHKEIFDNHMDYFVKEFIPYIESKYSVSHERDERVFYGTSNSADFGITLSMRNPELLGEYWCFSPIFSDIGAYSFLKYPVSYKIAWGAKEEIEASFDYFPSLIQTIRKRGGKVDSFIYEGGHERPRWREQFVKVIKQKFRTL